MKHCLVVLVFASMWTLPSILHFLNEGSIDRAKDSGTFLQVQSRQVSLILGASSGLMTTVARLLEPGLGTVILKRISRLIRKKSSVEMLQQSFSLSSDASSIKGPTMNRGESIDSIGDPILRNSREFATTLLVSLHLVLLRCSPTPPAHHPSFSLSESLISSSDLSTFVENHCECPPSAWVPQLC